jgi:D-lactate dehydrogenase (cytochrome)
MDTCTLTVRYPDDHAPPRRIDDAERIEQSFAAYTEDESRLTGAVPAAVYFPETTHAVSAAVRDACERGLPITVSGARTGIAGGAVVSEGSALLSLEKLVHTPRVAYNDREAAWTVHVGAGTSLEELAHVLRTGTYEASGEPPQRLFYPVDPTEVSASAAGTVATNAGGARTLHYGPTRDWVVGLTVVLADGGVVSLSRGEREIQHGGLVLEGPEGVRSIELPDLPMPHTKHTGGYYLQPRMDPIDLFIGGEGTLCVVTEVELRLAPMPEQRLFLCLYVPESGVAGITRAVKEAEALTPLALEYMDSHSLGLLRTYRAEQGESSGVPAFPDDAECVLYVELVLDGPEGFETAYEALEDILGSYGVSLDDSWAGESLNDADAMKAFRHALPERINSIIGERRQSVPEISKVGTDMAVSDDHLADILTAYREGLDAAGLEYCIFGHIGNGHLHVNILPRTREEKDAAYELYERFARRVAELGGSLFAEHGVGRLKRRFMPIQYTADQIDAMRRVKTWLDPDGRLNPGVLFP